MTETELIFAVPVALLAVATILAKTRGARRLVLVVKPLTMAAIFGMYAAEGASASHHAAWCLVGAGLVASAVGDVLLELGSDQFIAGLASFLAAHVCYLAAFALRVADAHGTDLGIALFAALPVLVVYATLVLRALDPGLGAFRAPVRAYVSVILGMAWAASAWFLHARSAPSALALAGALCFFASDTLAFDRFRAPLRFANPLILSTYFVAQFLIAASAR